MVVGNTGTERSVKLTDFEKEVIQRVLPEYLWYKGLKNIVTHGKYELTFKPTYILPIKCETKELIEFIQ